MKKLLFTAGLALMCTMYLSSCIKIIATDGTNSSDIIVSAGSKREKPIVASDKMETINKNCKNFNSIEISGVIQVIYIQSDGSKYTLEGPDNVLPLVKIEERGSKLKVFLTHPVRFSEDKKVTLTLYGSCLGSVDISGASGFKCDRLENPKGNLDFECSGASNVNLKNVSVSNLEFDMSGASGLNGNHLKADVISVELSGACGGNLNNLMAGRVETEISGASSLTLGGEAETVDYEVSGASSLNAYGLNAQTGKAEASGTSSIEASIRQVLSKEATGYSNIKIK